MFSLHMSFSYTGEGIYSTYEDGTPVSMILDSSFKETQPIYDVDYIREIILEVLVG